MLKSNIFLFLVGVLVFTSCESFEDFNKNPNEPTEVSAAVLFPGAIRKSVNTNVDAAFLVGNNAAQLSAKILRLEVDAYNWNAFPTYWEGWYESLTDAIAVEQQAADQGNENLQGAAITLRSWIYANLTNAYGAIPYSEAIAGATDNFTPVYDDQAAIYTSLLAELERANALLTNGTGEINGDILLDGDAEKWRKFANSLRLRLLMLASEQLPDAGTEFASIVNNEDIMTSNADDVVLTYTGSFPNEFPLLPLKTGDFDALAISETSLEVLRGNNDPRILRYARPNNEDFTNSPEFIGAVNGLGQDCPKSGASRLGVQYYNYPDLTDAASLGLPMAEGLVMTYPEVAFLLAEASEKGWINGSTEDYYRAGVQASHDYYQVDYATFGWEDFTDFYNNSGVAFATTTDIWEQKWLALFFVGLEPYFEVRRWYVASGNSFAGIPFMAASCGNLNDDELPLRFPYPGEEQSLNNENYQNAIDALGGNSQNGKMWLVE